MLQRIPKYNQLNKTEYCRVAIHFQLAMDIFIQPVALQLQFVQNRYPYQSSMYEEEKSHL